MTVKSLSDGVVVNKFKFMMRIHCKHQLQSLIVHTAALPSEKGQELPFLECNLHPCIEHPNQDWTISSRLPFFTTGSICRKSPPKTTTLPPKGSNRAAIPEEATARAIFPFDLIAAKIVL
ncbi:uncharacterized protein LOC136070814 [Quercus suber]|uniref:uncharacterized protein LOC136070814 n=1 Tax=Quercus suber TaxID=58331 RepID=UPI0032DEC40D